MQNSDPLDSPEPPPGVASHADGLDGTQGLQALAVASAAASVQPQSSAAAGADIKTTSMKVLRWAHELSLLCNNSYFPGDGYESPEFHPPVTGPAVATLRSRQIRFVGTNAASRSITLFLSKASPTAKQASELPVSADGFNLKYEQGLPDTINPTTISESTTTATLWVKGEKEYYTCGSSISLGNTASAGTFGCIVKDGANKLYGLSNNHVTGGCNYAPTGLPILAPGVIDVHPAAPVPFTIGVHARQLPMAMGDPSSVDSYENQDAAVFAILDPARVTSMQREYYDTPSAFMSLQAGMEVEKVGRSSDHTKGKVVSAITGPMGIAYNASQYRFNGDVYFDSLYVVYGLTDRFSEAGDSGSLVTHVASDGIRYAVGIVVGGGANSKAPGGKISLIMPIDTILNKFALSLVHNHNT